MAQLLATKDVKYDEVITAAQQVMTQADVEFGQVGATAPNVIEGYDAS